MMIWIYKTDNIVSDLMWDKVVRLIFYHCIVNSKVIIKVIVLNKIM